MKSDCKSVYETDQDKRISFLLIEFTAGEIISHRRTKVQEAVVFSFAEDGFQQAIVEVYCDSKSESTLVKIIVCLRRLKGVDTSRQVIGEMIAELVFKVVRSEKAYQAENITKVTTGRMLQADKELFKVSQS